MHLLKSLKTNTWVLRVLNWGMCPGVRIDVKSSPYMVQRKRLARQRMWSGKDGALVHTNTL